MKKLIAISVSAFFLVGVLSSCQSTTPVAESEETFEPELVDYIQYPGILDFGKYSGVEPSTEPNKVSPSYIYINIESKIIDSYLIAIRNAGFADVGFSTMGGTTYWLENSQYSLMLVKTDNVNNDLCGFGISIKDSESLDIESLPPATYQPTKNKTIGEKNALESAKSYLSFMPFSYSGLIEQLEYEGYTHSEAVYGADNCGADWYEQAALSARSYLDSMSFSRQGLIEQLEYEGFTHAQAVYGVEQNGY